MNAAGGFAAAVVACVVLACSDARADDTRAIDVARRSFDAGMDQYRSGDLEGARLSLAQSYAAWPSIETLRNLAIAELNTDHFVEALRHFETYARDPSADPKFVKSKLPALLRRCEQHVGHLRVRAPAGTAIAVDGRRIGDANEPIDVVAGVHTVRIRSGEQTEERSALVSAAHTAEVDFVGAPAGTANAPRVDSIETVAAFPSSQDRSAPPVAVDTRSESSDPSPSSAARIAWVIGLSAGAAVVAGTGVALGLVADGDRSTLDALRAGRDPSSCAAVPSDPAYCDRLHDVSNAQRTAAAASDVAFVAAGTLAISAVAVFAFWPTRPRSSVGLQWIAPAWNGGSGAVLAGGRF